ncbi:MAG: hypothetical protein EZS28_013935 [Streblomastix strix]|uniref:Uncharacterized protein n=1 Tax=Streblomastix strix TaxID=222440 RepID=A0A5J4W6S0_9EUKA|nr:MAG: hypothetical protein EZS28_013935 [Streblomastix strix]
MEAKQIRIVIVQQSQQDLVTEKDKIIVRLNDEAAALSLRDQVNKEQDWFKEQYSQLRLVMFKDPFRIIPSIQSKNIIRDFALIRMCQNKQQGNIHQKTGIKNKDSIQSNIREKVASEPLTQNTEPPQFHQTSQIIKETRQQRKNTQGIAYMSDICQKLLSKYESNALDQEKLESYQSFDEEMEKRQKNVGQLDHHLKIQHTALSSIIEKLTNGFDSFSQCVQGLDNNDPLIQLAKEADQEQKGYNGYCGAGYIDQEPSAILAAVDILNGFDSYIQDENILECQLKAKLKVNEFTEKFIETSKQQLNDLFEYSVDQAELKKKEEQLLGLVFDVVKNKDGLWLQAFDQHNAQQGIQTLMQSQLYYTDDLMRQTIAKLQLISSVTDEILESSSVNLTRNIKDILDIENQLHKVLSNKDSSPDEVTEVLF